MTAIIPLFPGKAPSDVTDFSYDFINYLENGETILTAAVATTPSGITVGSPIINKTVVTVWLGGGSLGTSYLVAYTITTSLGNTETRSVILNCQTV